MGNDKLATYLDYRDVVRFNRYHEEARHFDVAQLVGGVRFEAVDKFGVMSQLAVYENGGGVFRLSFGEKADILAIYNQDGVMTSMGIGAVGLMKSLPEEVWEDSLAMSALLKWFTQEQIELRFMFFPEFNMETIYFHQVKDNSATGEIVGFPAPGGIFEKDFPVDEATNYRVTAELDRKEIKFGLVSPQGRRVLWRIGGQLDNDLYWMGMNHQAYQESLSKLWQVHTISGDMPNFKIIYEQQRQGGDFDASLNQYCRQGSIN